MVDKVYREYREGERVSYITKYLCEPHDLSPWCSLKEGVSVRDGRAVAATPPLVPVPPDMSLPWTRVLHAVT